MRIAAHDVSRLSRTVAGCAGVTVTVFGARQLLTSTDVVRPAVALLPAGLSLVLAVLPGPAPLVRLASRLLAVSAAALGAIALADRPAGGVAILLSGLALALIDVRLPSRPAGTVRYRVADPLLTGAAIIALVAVVSRLLTLTVPHDGEPVGVMSLPLAGAVLALAAGAILARGESAPPQAPDPPEAIGTTIRRVLPVLIAVPVVAALVSALAVRYGTGRPEAAVGIGATLAALSVFALAAILVRSLEGADRRQRDLVAQLHQRQEFADTLLQSMNEAVMVLDANYRVIDVNRRWRELTGQRAEDALGSRPHSMPPDGTGDWLVQHKDGTEVPVLATMAAIPAADGSPQAYVATYVDIGDRKRAEDMLSRHADELMRSNDRLREANTRLESALAFKNDLTSMLTHDVAQPISSIASLAELLSGDWTDLPDDIRFDLATKIDKNTRRLIKMMNDLQLLFRLDTGSITARRTPVSVLEVVEAVAGDVSEDDVQIAVDEQVSALADRGHLTVVVKNLLSNALAYGEGPVEVRADRRADTVLLIVQDRGPGIPEELVPRLFDRFVRGAGLGLFIVRHLVEANGGTVRYERAEPRGARLVVTFESASISA